MGKYVPYEASELPLIQKVQFLNCFFRHFRFMERPKGTPASIFLDGWSRMQHQDQWSVSRRTGISNYPFSYPSLAECCADRSDKRLDQTPRQFYAEVDGVVESLGISAEEIAKRINAVLMQRHDVSIEELRRLTAELDTFLLPIYIALREAGYNKADLWN
jgi:hypothetical protein